LTLIRLLRAIAIAHCLVLIFPISTEAFGANVGSAAGKQTLASVEDETGALRIAGRYREADNVAKETLRHLQSDPDAPRHAAEIALRAEQTLARLASLPESAQIAFREAELTYCAKKDCWRARDYSLFAVAQSRYQQAAEWIFGHDNYESARLLVNAEHDYRNWGHFVQAERCAREALAIDQHLFPKDHPVVMDALGSLACALMSQGRLDEAEPLFRSVLASAIANEGERSADAAGGYNSLGVALAAEGDYEGSAEMLARAEEIQRANCGFDHEIFLSNYARALFHLGRLDEAETRVRKALDIYRKAHGDSCSEVAGQLASLAEIDRIRGALASADSLYARAAAIDRKVLGPDHPEFLHPQIARAAIQLQLGHPAKARSILEPLLPQMDPLLRGSERSRSLLILARALRELGKPSEAEPMLAEAAQLYERARGRAGGEFKRATLNPEAPYADLALSRLDLGRPESAWLAVESGLGRCLADLLLANHSRSPHELALADSLRQALNECEERLRALTVEHSTDRSILLARRQTRAALIETEAAWSRLQSEILESHGLPPGGGVSLSHVQALLDPSTAIVGWVDGEGADSEGGDAWGYVLRRTGPVRWVKLPLSRGEPGAQDRGMATTFREDLIKAAVQRVRVAIDDRIESGSRGIANERIVPLLPLLTGIGRLIVIPSGPMLGVPVEAMQLEGGVWLSDRFEIVYSPSASVFAALADAHLNSPIPGNRILLVGDPAFRPSPELAIPASAKAGQALVNILSSCLGVMAPSRGARSTTGDVLRSLQPLPHSRTEMQTIASMYSDATTLLGTQASTKALTALVRSGEITRFRTLHFATHALIDDRTPERSGLVLSQVYDRDRAGAAGDENPDKDGILRMKQIVGDWRLDADLVTLSGCSTALGRQAGGEGYVGLAQAFLLAGARSVLVSLWSVDDEATSLYMRRFYADLTGADSGARPGAPMNKPTALAEARRFLRDYQDPDGARRFTHPCYWAAFVLIGDPD
jgi:CHAT domain-containing protein/tetratricopeptide (TPR) repeat protein